MTSRFDEGIAHLHRYRAVHGTSNPRQRDMIDGFKIGQWVSARRTDYRRGALPAERIRRIETEFPDWRWKMNARTSFSAGLAHLRSYVAAHGTSNARQHDVIDGFPIGTWVASRRAEYRAGHMRPDHVQQIESEFPDWQWTLRARAPFHVGLDHVHRYVAAHGSSSPPRDATIDGFPIGQWVAKRRTEYRRRRLSPERITQLETEFPDWQWNIRATGARIADERCGRSQ
ncbi:helicase associated domain-containing protein [Gordonia sp. NPDC058843]|uniref:helicase associated domain-containing protein n=1 Tax=Gordonia sp. NPDC058843 TaxID=3346648 RepID=UPI00367947A9